ncbi:hypothetical protein OSB04_020206 [Centaurea solstitialis]|uniref:Uncharacterized protein n=1 Tax=Centaurea solstitialis TaxID=347529 RepID=A0AA38SS89_9ASTR|nr:hypothetical protein OSB04_020206 [Centaurea solstitialis]
MVYRTIWDRRRNMWSTYEMYRRLYARNGSVGIKKKTTTIETLRRGLSEALVLTSPEKVEDMTFYCDTSYHGSYVIVDGRQLSDVNDLFCVHMDSLVPVRVKGIVSFSLKEWQDQFRSWNGGQLYVQICLRHEILVIRRKRCGGGRVLGCDLDWATPKHNRKGVGVTDRALCLQNEQYRTTVVNTGLHGFWFMKAYERNLR